MDKSLIATTSNRNRPNAKLLVITASENPTSAPIQTLTRGDFVDQFEAGDVLVANSAGTLPASFTGTHLESQRSIELRLAQALDPEMVDYSRWKAVLFGDGDWRLPTEARTETPTLLIGDHLSFDNGLMADVIGVSTDNPRLIDIRFDASDGRLLHQLYAAGRLIQYSYQEEELALWDGQTIFAGRPIALEAPSASFMLTWEMVMALKTKGVEVAPLIHAAGISSTGETDLDQLLPLPEFYEIPERTAAAVNRAKAEGRRIIAMGTSVTRALESAVTPDGRVSAGSGTATLLLSPTYERQIVNGLVTGMHEDGTSHLQLLQSFAPWRLIEKAYAKAKSLNYLWHEYGDSCLILA